MLSSRTSASQQTCPDFPQPGRGENCRLRPDHDQYRIVRRAPYRFLSDSDSTKKDWPRMPLHHRYCDSCHSWLVLKRMTSIASCDVPATNGLASVSSVARLFSLFQSQPVSQESLSNGNRIAAVMRISNTQIENGPCVGEFFRAGPCYSTVNFMAAKLMVTRLAWLNKSKPAQT